MPRRKLCDEILSAEDRAVEDYVFELFIARNL